MTVSGVIIIAACISAVVAVSSSSRIGKINSGHQTWKADSNKLSEKSFEYKKKLCGALVPKPKDRLPVKKNLTVALYIPFKFDARQQWPDCPSIYSIKNQGNCGSGWAVGAASCVSDRLCIASDSKIKHSISIENLLTCCSACVLTEGCDGGYPDKAWAYIQSTGLVTGGDYNSYEGCQPYQISPAMNESSDMYTPRCSKTCTNTKYGRSYDEDLHFDKSAYILKANVRYIQSEILRYGPVEATFDVYEDFFDYTSGVYQHTSDILIGKHAVRVLGWGIENDTPYWLVANSWGKFWGENGLFKIRRGINECRFEEFISAGQIIVH